MADAKKQPAKTNDSKRIDAIIAVLKANGMSLPKELALSEEQED